MKWIIETRATVRRVYEVEALDERAAIEIAHNHKPLAEEDENEETVAVKPAA